MQLEHAFTVPASVDEVWRAMLDPERVAPCMPGATLTGVDGSTFTGKVKVKLGPVSMQYKGTGAYTGTDEGTRTVVITASGKDAKGNGTAAATVTLHLTGDDTRTEGTAVTDLTVTGRPAQFGRGMISEVGGKILEQFAANLGEELAGPADEATGGTAAAETAAPGTAAAEAPAAGTAATEAAAADDAHPAGANGSAPAPRSPAPAPDEETEALDLSQYARGAVLKRALPLVGIGALAALIAVLVLRRRPSRGR